MFQLRARKHGAGCLLCLWMAVTGLPPLVRPTPPNLGVDRPAESPVAAVTAGPAIASAQATGAAYTRAIAWRMHRVGSR
jgi:hypothetical protein